MEIDKPHFISKVDRRSRQSMVNFLSGHTKYHTMNSWNVGSSYAHNVKINRFVPRELLDTAFDLLMADDAQYRDEIDSEISLFTETHNSCYTIGFNGRSSGYLVLYHSTLETSGHKSYCTKCGQRNYTTVESTGKRCGKCNSDSRINRIFYNLKTSGRGFNYEYDEMTIFELRNEVDLVISFDNAVQAIADIFIDACQNCVVVEKTIMVSKTIHVAQCAMAA